MTIPVRPSWWWTMVAGAVIGVVAAGFVALTAGVVIMG